MQNDFQFLFIETCEELRTYLLNISRHFAFRQSVILKLKTNQFKKQNKKFDVSIVVCLSVELLENKQTNTLPT